MAKNNQTNKSVTAVHQEITHSFSGPVPDPLSLEKYEKIQPGLADRLVRMAEEEAAHRREIEKASIKAAVTTSKLGMFFAFMTALMFGGLIFYSIFKGFDQAALAISIGSVASVAGLFIIFRSRKPKRKDKQDIY